MDSSDARTPVRSRWSCVGEGGTPQEPISPELVLIDPELARRVRAVAVVGPLPPPPPARLHEIPVADARPRADRHAPRLRVALAAVGTATSIALVTFATAAVPSADELPYVEASPPAEDVATPARTFVTTPAQPTTAPTSGAAKDDVAPPRTGESAETVSLRWPPVPSADYYNVILWSDGARLRDYWPQRPRIVLVPRELARLGVANGSTVHWFVYPITLRGGTRLAGSVHANGTFTLPVAHRAR